MGRKFILDNSYYGDEEEYKMFKKKNIEINEGLTVLVGCNGTGKTTFLKQIKSQLEKKNIPVLLHSNTKDGEKEMRSKAMFNSNYKFVAKTLMSSEGENIVNVLAEIAREMGYLTRINPNAEELWFLFDGIDSGLSIDNVEEIKNNLISTVIKINKSKKVYFVISANAYEFARNEKCFDVYNGKYIEFKDYEDYRNFILKSRDIKNKRYGE